MDIPAGLFPAEFAGFAWALMALLFGYIGVTLPWKRLLDNDFSHLLLGAAVVSIVTWSIRAGVTPGLSFHLLGVSTLTLMLGWRFGLLAVALALLATTFNYDLGWEAYGINLLLMGGIPVLVTQGLLYLAQRHLPHNFFVYVFFNAFFAAGLSGAMVGFTAMSLMLLTGVHEYELFAYEYLPFFPLMFFPEAVFNGMLMTGLVVLRPAWVESFDDDMYLKGK